MSDEPADHRHHRGDPSGIGPEIAAQGFARSARHAVCQPELYGPHTPDGAGRFPPGTVSAASARAAHAAIAAATADALARRVAAMVTAPINKEAFAMAGLRWPGHTELLADLCGVLRCRHDVLVGEARVVLATVHVPLEEVPAVLTPAGCCRRFG